MALRFGWGLQGFLRGRLSPEECRQLIRERLRQRQGSFLHLVEAAIFRHPSSPYLPLFRLAGVDFQDVAHWTQEEGVEGALARLAEAGVWLSLGEFKGRQPLRRAELERTLTDRDFDNPLIAGDFPVRTGGSRSPRTVLFISFDHILHEAGQDRIFLEAFDLMNRPSAIWRPVPPASAGLKAMLRRAKIGAPLKRWFSQVRPSLLAGEAGYFGVTYLSALSSRLWRGWGPFPQYVPLAEAGTVARWLAACRAAGTPALLDTIVSSGVRVCREARDLGLDISGTFMRLGGEPFTPAKARLVQETGSRAACHYAMAEFGRIGIACASPAELDDVHVLSDKIAVIQRPRRTSGATVPAIFLSSLHPSSPKVAINVESGDYGTLTERNCGCPFSELGLHHHLHGIRSYEKLTTEGMHFLGVELLQLLEQELPANFGGDPTDYQLVEEEEGGMTRLILVVSPRVGELDEDQLVETVLAHLAGRAPGSKMMVEHLRQGSTLLVARRDPLTTGTAKIQPLHVPQTGDRT